MADRKTRCAWISDPLMRAYHDEEWGVPLHDDRKHFEFLVLDAAQAGLSWATVLKKRESYRRAFDNFDPGKVARYGKRKIESLLRDPGIIRNRQKIESAVRNARAFLEVQEEESGFDPYIWRFVGGAPRINCWKKLEQLPASTPESEAMSRDLKGRGFSFVGPTICYAYMQAAGMVIDHVTECFRYRELVRLIRGAKGQEGGGR